ncbi:hypothetical protein [Micrococcus sp. KRD096]|uniref:hypothetical protein n=1 Tax=Micrococcus sp. KRD096 TaxID=2729721 RepID=UPI0019D1A2F7|nr:hypothetical protein [Micrococcus sp. KRD096]
MTTKRSRCSSNVAVEYFWRFTANGQHIERTVEFLQKCLDKPGRVQNEYLEELNAAAFEDHLELAAKGRLQPGTHVKEVRRHPEVDLYEIRWDGIAVQGQDIVSGLYKDPEEVLVRLYYVETGEAWVVGLHGHEKAILESDEETNQAQDVEIDKAAELARVNAEARWGVPELIQRG